jgi:type IV pilus assembly protein PilM
VELRKAKARPQLWTYGILDQPLDIHLLEAPPPPAPLPGAPRPAPEPEDEKKKKKKPEPAEPTDPRIENYAALLKHLLEQTRTTTKSVTASLPVSQVFHAVVNLPEVSPKEVDYHVRSKVAKMLPRALDDMQVVHQIVPAIPGSPGRDIKVLVTAAPKRLIRFYSDIFSRAGLVLEELETEAFAIERALVGRDQATVMVVDIGAERTNFFIIDQGLPLTHRSIQIGGRSIDNVLGMRLGIDPSLVSQMKFDLSRAAGGLIPSDLFTSVTEPIIKEIQYGFDLFLHQTGNEEKRPEKIILTGGAALFPTFVASIQAAFEMKVFVGDPWARVVYQQRLKPTLDAFGPRMGVSIGLALRKILPPEVKKPPAQRKAPAK